MLIKAWTKVNGVYNRYVKNETGAQALEWVALGLVVLAVMGAIASGIGNNTALGETIMTKLGDLISNIGTGGGE
jgi:Flp pilus assembly pilin Flp